METTIEYPKFQAWATVTREGQPDNHFTFTGEVPQQIMDSFQQVLGDSKARVSVSVDMGIKEFGTGASGMVTVSLSCGQDQNTIQQAISLAGGAAKWYANHWRGEAEQEVNRLVQERKNNNLTQNGQPKFA